MPLTREDLENDVLRKQYEGIRDHVPLVPVEAFHASLDAVLAGWNPKNDLWVFAYGSLIWNPLIHVEQHEVTRISGYHRRFCLWSTAGRGTPRQPGLVLALDAGHA